MSTEKRWDGGQVPAVSRGLRRVTLLAAVLVTVYAGLLRLEALAANYGQLGQPRWSETLTRYAVPVARRLRPQRVVWGPIAHPYVNGDPINYLRYAREMRHFYQSHVREPVFLALTRIFLWLTGGRDISVSFASATGGTLAVFATFLLGAAASSPAVGVAAALALAIEFQAIAWSIEGWRDDTFMFFVTLNAWSFLLLRQRPSIATALLSGITGAAACLTRLTALSFIIPVLLWLVIEPRHEARMTMLKSTTIAAFVMSVLVAPYLIACARATGDPFFAINYHTRYYRAAEGLPPDESVSALAYARTKLTARPAATLDTAAQGLLTVPFLNKWHGLDPWGAAVAPFLRWSALGGMVLAIWCAAGRLLLVVVLTSLVPYMLTWPIGGGGEWRFTQHVYPFYLVFAFAAIAAVLRYAVAAARHVARRTRLGGQRPLRRGKLWHVAHGTSHGTGDTLHVGRGTWHVAHRTWIRAAVVLLVGVVAWVAYYAMPLVVMHEALEAGDAVDIRAGGRDKYLFVGAWSSPMTGGNVSVRVAQSGRVSMRVPLPPDSNYLLTLRMDPAETIDPARQPRVSVFINGHPLGQVSMTRDPARMGTYRFRVPRETAHGSSRLDFVASHTVRAADAGTPFASLPEDSAVAFRLWYVRLEPDRK